MARFHGNEFLYDVFQQFLNLCVINNRSLLWPDSEIWTPENVSDVKKRMIDGPIMGNNLSFEEKLQKQMANASPKLWGIIADIYYIYFLPSTFIKFETKHRDIEWAAEQGALVQPPPNASIWEAQKTGFTRTGLRYHFKYSQFWLILYFVNHVKRQQDRDAIVADYSELQKALDNIIENIPNKSDRAYDMRHAILYMTYPDLFERIISTRDKENIIKTYKKKISGTVPIDRDEAIRMIRKTLSIEYDKPDRPFDFYRDLKQDEWKPKKKMPKGTTTVETETGVVMFPPEDSPVLAKSDITKRTGGKKANYENDLQDLDEIQEDESTLSVNEVDEVSTERRRIFTDKSDPPVSALWMRYKEGDLILDPIFQRRKVWDDIRSSRLIESVILEVPLPVFYLAESKDNKEEVIDGQQRLRAFFRFLDNEYSLKGLRAAPDYNGSLFKDLDKATQKVIREYSIRTITFKKESDENLRFEIFERLNTGAVPLNEQELRNCVYRGNYNKLLIELSADPDYMYLMGLRTPEKRMRDVEYVLRFAAFYHATYLKYKPSMARFLNEDMREHQNISEEKAKNLRSAFKTTVNLIRSLLGQYAFKRYHRGSAGNLPNGYWEPKQFNASLYDILMSSFADKDKNQIMANLDAIREAFIVLMTENQDFIDAIELSTSAQKMVTKRFDIWRLTLDNILANSSKQPRCFTTVFKKSLYETDPTCLICDQHIVSVDDAAVDHIDQYWLGGKTIEANARLTHRYCNWARSKNDKVNHPIS